MVSQPDGGHAFPAMPVTDSIYKGMTLRDWFAGQALSEVAQYIDLRPAMKLGTMKMVAQTAYELADAMIAERDKP